MESNLIFIDDVILVESLALLMFTDNDNRPTFFYKKKGEHYVYEIEPIRSNCRGTMFTGEDDKFIIIGHVLHTNKYVCVSTADEKMKEAFDRSYHRIRTSLRLK